MIDSLFYFRNKFSQDKVVNTDGIEMTNISNYILELEKDLDESQYNLKRYKMGYWFALISASISLIGLMIATL